MLKEANNAQVQAIKNVLGLTVKILLTQPTPTCIMTIFAENSLILKHNLQ